MSEETPRQLPLELPHEAALGRDDYLVGDCNRAAFDLITAWPDWPSNFVLLAGPVGAGKTHLVSIWQQISGAEVIRADNLASQDVLALARKGPVAVEDAHGGIDEEALFHLLNAARDASRQVLITSRSWPAAWNLTLPDLASRLRLATPVEVAEPDDDLLRRVLVKLFADRQLSVDLPVIEYLVVRMERSLEAANRIVATLDREALAARRRITRPMAAAVLEHDG
ncbi:regulatory inactivation of DnaA Hda protein [Breoghania corrubedonensis]|uniref:Regulatory inactivation of DnaA Hda protein n=1 Tax=Breoghania corrubedonensis TaxID=665038 RepID=A0A2T5V8G5_9HYPH|nr:DnaA/Hda family protein [Breoghania corrubedonensis]PTW60030.1 regulatory inactivation of DnaA Hda protein [Breoghania corrubedonensis]